MEKYRELLVKARNAGLSVPEISDRLGYSASAVNNWVKNGIRPDDDAIRDICEGLPSIIEAGSYRKTLYHYIDKVMKDNGIGYDVFSTLTNINKMSLVDWCVKKQIGSYKSCKKILLWKPFIDKLDSIKVKTGAMAVILKQTCADTGFSLKDSLKTICVNDETFESWINGSMIPTGHQNEAMRIETSRLLKRKTTRSNVEEKAKSQKVQDESDERCKYFTVPKTCKFCGSSRIRSNGRWWCFHKGYDLELCENWKKDHHE